jgi:hypothetical protein
LKKGASQRIAEIEAVEARADEYLVKFGSSIGGFLRDAITISPPTTDAEGAKGEVVFEAQAGDGKKKHILYFLHPFLLLGAAIRLDEGANASIAPPA